MGGPKWEGGWWAWMSDEGGAQGESICLHANGVIPGAPTDAFQPPLKARFNAPPQAAAAGAQGPEPTISSCPVWKKLLLSRFFSDVGSYRSC